MRLSNLTIKWPLAVQCAFSTILGITNLLPDTEPDWELERLLRKRTYRKGRGYATGCYAGEFDSWIKVKEIDNARDLMNEFEQQDGRNKEAVPPKDVVIPYGGRRSRWGYLSASYG